MGLIDPMKEYLLFRIANFLSAVIPRPFAYWISLRVADLYFFRDTKGRRAVMANLRRVLEFNGGRPSELELAAMARLTFQYFGKYLVDFFRFVGARRKQAERLVRLEHEEYLEQAQAVGRGVLVVTAHLGSWEIGGMVLASKGFPINVVVLRQKAENVNALFQGYRRRRGVNVIPLGSAARSILRKLKNKEWVALLADRDYSAHSGTVQFFGAVTHLPRGPAWLCCRSGAPILPGFLLRQADDTFVLRFHPPIAPGEEATVETVQRKVVEVLEREIGENPAQWLIFHDMWGNDNGDGKW